MTAFTAFVRGALLGAAAMYLLDPDRGRRRRAIARDKTRSAASQAVAFVDSARRDARHRLRAVRARATRLSRRREEVPADVVLVERVRARLGRVVQHPHAVRVSAEQGCVRLSGPILADEYRPLKAAVAKVRGVRDVNDEGLALYRSADHVSALQGGSRHPAHGRPHEDWSPAVRLAAFGGGGMLALRALSRRGVARMTLSTAGLALVARAASNRPLEHLLGAFARLTAAGRPGNEVADMGDDWTRTAPLAPPAPQSQS